MSLTKRQVEIVQRLALGDTCDEVADYFDRSVLTVRTQVKQACQRIEAKNIPHLVALSLSQGLIKPLCILLVVTMCNSHLDGLRRGAPKRPYRRLDDIPAIVI